MELIPVVQDQVFNNAVKGKIHVRLTEGRFQTLRRFTSWPLMALFFGLVWIQVDGQPCLLFSFEQRRIILFGNALLWHDLPLLAGLLITAACLLFFVAVGWGRIWCGFACPQSIWTWLFIRIEQLIEGPARRRARLEGTPLRGLRLLRRIAKHGLWLALALITAVTFTGYFVPAREIATAALAGQMSATLIGWLVIMTGITYLNAGLIREKICLHACPYSRFQGVMFDKHTLTVSYDSSRGGVRSSKKSPGGGDCVDCSICVQVCPVGIDIRDGLQAACIDCGACIDACDRVMDKVGRPPGLIRFASAAQLSRQAEKFWRPRLLGYGCVMVCSLAAVLYGFSHTKGLVAQVERDRQALFTYSEAGDICNDYRIKVESANPEHKWVTVSLSPADGFKLLGPSQLDLAKSNAKWLSYRVCARNLASTRTVLSFRFASQQFVTTKASTFISLLI